MKRLLADCDTHVASGSGLSARRLQLQLFRRQSSRLHSEIFQKGVGLQDA